MVSNKHDAPASGRLMASFEPQRTLSSQRFRSQRTQRPLRFNLFTSVFDMIISIKSCVADEVRAKLTVLLWYERKIP